MSIEERGISGELKSLVGGLKIVLQIFFWLGLAFTIILPFFLNMFGVNLVLSIIVAYPNGLLLLGITKKFIKLFDSIKNNNPFCKENVSLLKKTGTISSVQSVCWALDFIILCLFAEKLDIIVGLVIIFLFVLFLGVGIALYILSELLDKAVDYKSENDLTI